MNTEYQTQSDKFIGYNHFKCKLVDQVAFDVKDEWGFPVDPIHVKSLTGLQPEKYLNGYYGKYRDDPRNTDPDFEHLELYLQFRDNGIILGVTYTINLLTGNLTLFLSMPYIIKDEFKPHSDMPFELVNDINAAPVDDRIIDMNDDLHDRFIEYVASRYMKQFINYVRYLESLIGGSHLNEPVCINCVYKHQYKLTGTCDKLIFNKSKTRI